MSVQSTNTLANVIQRELKRIVSEPVIIFILFVAPILAYGTIWAMFSSGVARKLPVVVVDADHSATSRKVVSMVAASPIANVYAAATLADAKALTLSGKADAILYIPQDLEKHILRIEQSPIVLYINNINIVKGGLIRAGLYKTLASVSTGISIKMYQKNGIDAPTALALAMPIALDSHVLFNPYSNYAYFLMLGLLPLMLVVFTFLGSTYAVGIELKEGTAADLMQTADGSIVLALVGKMLPYTIVLFGNSLIMDLILRYGVGLAFGGNLIVILFSQFMLIVSYQLLAILVVSLTHNLRLSLSLGSAYTMMALTFSGLTFPAMSMPLSAQIFSWVFPFTFWLKIFMNQTIQLGKLAQTAAPFLVLGLFIAVGLISMPLTKKKLSNPEYWGKR
ncbi:MAG: hypothetical protein RIS47_122 [Bacteroidota bacterium]|jgi:ABC-2 type transport system permease protein